MTLAELLAWTEERADEAEETGAMVPAAPLYRQFGRRLASVDGLDAGYATTEEAAEYLSLAADTVSRKCNAGEFEGAVKRGRGWRIPWEAVRGYLTQGNERRDRIRLLDEN